MRAGSQCGQGHRQQGQPGQRAASAPSLSLIDSTRSAAAALFRSLRLSRLLWLSGSGGRVLDPSRHELEGALPEQEPESPWSGAEELFPVVREVCVLTGAPLLAPKDLRMVMGALVQVLTKQEFKLPTTVQSVCRQCVESEGLRVRPRDVNFLVRGMQMNGHAFGQGVDDEATFLRVE